MSPHEIEVGKTYHNGKDGPRSYSARKVLKLNVKGPWGIVDGVRYLQVKGPYSGEETVIRLSSFASWAKGEVTD
ncbi:hypothetical protein [Paenibacillus chitinolyticus]|uniref:hypothetical protein n=1 Tax=Paenibacillus chitinolyticus TaxID=79263 RepID=UPI00364B699C